MFFFSSSKSCFSLLAFFIIILIRIRNFYHVITLLINIHIFPTAKLDFTCSLHSLSTNLVTKRSSMVRRRICMIRRKISIKRKVNSSISQMKNGWAKAIRIAFLVSFSNIHLQYSQVLFLCSSLLLPWQVVVDDRFLVKRRFHT